MCVCVVWQAQYAEVEGENARLKGVIKEKDHDLEQISKVKEKLTRERDSMADVIRQEFADRLVGTEDENKRLKSEMSELKASSSFLLPLLQICMTLKI